jgi:hypothetical protein
MRLSGTTVLRERDPTNQFTAQKNACMVWDFSRQNVVVPSPDKITEPRGYDSPARTMNRTGSPMALNVMVGGSPDYQGRSEAAMSFTSPPPDGGREPTPSVGGHRFARRKGT